MNNIRAHEHDMAWDWAWGVRQHGLLKVSQMKATRRKVQFSAVCISRDPRFIGHWLGLNIYFLENLGARFQGHSVWGRVLVATKTWLLTWIPHVSYSRSGITVDHQVLDIVTQTKAQVCAPKEPPPLQQYLLLIWQYLINLFLNHWSRICIAGPLSHTPENHMHLTELNTLWYMICYYLLNMNQINLLVWSNPHIYTEL